MCQKHGQDESMLKEMERFTTTFGNVIAQSAPHIYVSALSFAPQDSAILKYYAKRYGGLLRVERGGLSEWPRFECVIYGHRDGVKAVAVSKDGTRIVSG